ncbi:type VI secretion system lipoprotein TssJ [Flexibacterium corallicola]|uniref:type VI secretion system lipoprotein TssJ n=1 Tax=Flexibacterium corallicola TaxID=3037259 RepID=UPI00286F7EEC|nr:type VI secretion system lipoprotein TssJ [Pseudovibrio sp. M1P-2-3]
MMRIRRLLHLLGTRQGGVLALMALLFLGACDAAKIPKKVAKVIADPGIAVGEPKDQPSLIDITVFSEPGANRNDAGEHVPIDVWVFQLSDDGKFFQSEFDVVTESPKKALRSTFIDLSEVQVEPGNSKTIDEVELNKNTKFIAVAGGYINYDQIDWRAVEQVKSKGELYKLLVVLGDKKIITNLHR